MTKRRVLAFAFVVGATVVGWQIAISVWDCRNPGEPTICKAISFGGRTVGVEIVVYDLTGQPQ